MFRGIKGVVISIVAVSLGSASYILTLPSENLDLNNDGIVDVLDVQRFLRIISYERNTEVSPDLNNDGKIDIKDFQILLNHLGKKVVNIDKSAPPLYFPSTSINLVKQNTVRHQSIAKELPQISKNANLLNKFKGIFRNKTCIIHEHFFPVAKLKGSLCLAFHISPLSPPLA